MAEKAPANASNKQLLLQQIYIKDCSFESPRAQKKFFFRVASGSKITKKSETSFVVDRLTVTFDGAGHAVVRKGEPKELLIPCTLPQGKLILTLDYKW